MQEVKTKSKTMVLVDRRKRDAGRWGIERGSVKCPGGSHYGTPWSKRQTVKTHLSVHSLGQSFVHSTNMYWNLVCARPH